MSLVWSQGIISFSCSWTLLGLGCEGKTNSVNLTVLRWTHMATKLLGQQQQQQQQRHFQLI